MPKQSKELLDKGHNNLVQDLKELLAEAEDYQFHDFKNSEHAAPKIALVGRLDAIKDNVIEGRYDN